MKLTCVKYSSRELNSQEAEQTFLKSYKPPINLTLPEMVDWNTKGAVSSVIKQVGGCICVSKGHQIKGSVSWEVGVFHGVIKQVGMSHGIIKGYVSWGLLTGGCTHLMKNLMVSSGIIVSWGNWPVFCIISNTYPNVA